MRFKSFASLASTLLAVLLMFAATPVFAQSQDSNTSENSQAESAPVTATNETNVTSGPRSENGGNTNSQGDYNTNINQSNNASSSDAFAGSQSTRASGNSNQQNNNSSFGATAIGSPVTSTNIINAHNGPFASGAGTNADHIGDGNMNINQIAQAVGGSPAAGSSFIDGTGDTAFQTNNSCGDAVTSTPCGTATAGPVNVLNNFGNSTDPLFGGPAINGPAAFATGDAIASAGLIGDANLNVGMTARGFSGDADVGTLTVVGSGSSKVQAGTSTTTGTATSGAVDARNIGTAFVGGYASTTNGAVSSLQIGNASANLNLDAVASSGDAVTGALSVGASGNSAVQANVESAGDSSTSGDSAASNDALLLSGPVAINLFGTTHTAVSGLIGNSAANLSGVATSSSGDAVAGSAFITASGSTTSASFPFSGGNPFTDPNFPFVNPFGALGADASTSAVQQNLTSSGNAATSGDACASLLCGGGNRFIGVAGPYAVASGATATALQEGNAIVNAAQDSDALTGDAFAGSAETSAASGARVQATSLVTNTSSTSGNSAAGNDGTALAGPVAIAYLTATNAEQIGNSTTNLNQVATASSGDALGGHMLIDATNGSAVQASLNTGDADASSGDAVSANAGFVASGPLAGVTLTGLAVGGGSALQEGNNVATLNQDVNASSGDAVAGSMAVDANNSKVQSNNTSLNDSASSGLACAAPVCSGSIVTTTGGVTTTAIVAGGQNAWIVAGPVSFGQGNAVSEQQGNNTATWTQVGDAITGNSNAGSQALDAINSDVQANNKSSDSFADCTGTKCQATLSQDARLIAGTTSGAEAGNSASAEQIGNNSAAGTQGALASTGDLFAGSQDIGANGAAVQLGNTSSGATATAGPATAYSGVGVNPFTPTDPYIVGTSAFANTTSSAIATQQGNNALTFNGTVSAATGDAISGSQISGDSGVTYSAQINNSSVNAGALSGAATAKSVTTGATGARADDSDSLVNVFGNFSTTLNGNASASSGNAISGSQLINNGVVTSFP